MHHVKPLAVININYINYYRMQLWTIAVMHYKSRVLCSVQLHVQYTVACILHTFETR